MGERYLSNANTTAELPPYSKKLLMRMPGEGEIVYIQPINHKKNLEYVESCIWILAVVECIWVFVSASIILLISIINRTAFLISERNCIVTACHNSPQQIKKIPQQIFNLNIDYFSSVKTVGLVASKIFHCSKCLAVYLSMLGLIHCGGADRLLQKQNGCVLWCASPSPQDLTLLYRWL